MVFDAFIYSGFGSMFIGKFLTFLARHFSTPGGLGFATVGVGDPSARNRFSN
jgi:hypothetical protein